MKTSTQIPVTRVLGALALVAGAACSQHQPNPPTVQDLLDDRVQLDGVLLKCNERQGSTNHTDCVNARIAATKISTLHDEQKAAQRSQDFERRRDQLRQQQERERQHQDAQTKVDAYHLPVVPVDPPKDSSQPGQATVSRN